MYFAGELEKTEDSDASIYININIWQSLSRVHSLHPSLPLSLLPLSPQKCYCSLPSRQQHSALITPLVFTAPHSFYWPAGFFFFLLSYSVRLDLPFLFFFFFFGQWMEFIPHQAQ